MRTLLTVMIIISLTLFTACGGKKPQETADGVDTEQLQSGNDAWATETQSQPVVTEEDLTSGNDTTTVDLDQGRGIDEKAISDMDIEEINSKEFLKNVYFEFDQYNLTDNAIQQLEQNGHWLLDNTSVKVIIEGHCDERGTEEYNIALGERRANTAREFLIRMGVNASRMTTVSYGESRPMRDEANEIAWSLNRRAHFRVYAR